MTKTTSSLENDLADDFHHNGIGETTRRLNGLENRLGKVEKKLNVTYDSLGEHLVRPHPRPADDEQTAAETESLRTLSKAANAAQRRATPEGILERAEKVLTDPTTMGAVASYVSSGQLAKAADLLKDAEGRADKDDNDAALERTESQIKEHSMLATVSELGERVVSFERTLNALVSRLSRLESRPAASAAPATVAKGAGNFARRQAQEPDAANTVQGLQARLEAVFDSPAQVGVLSSALQAGRVDEVRRAVEQAEVRHEAAMKKRDRRGL